ncbi:MAG: DUF998 domain-containing protein [Streptosporangiales bacterium]|nr:DUF998 domain-containing protein [Streptosporangiales bacterium]
MAEAPQPPLRPTGKRLLLCGLVAGPLFTVAYLIEGATRADYDPMRDPVSSLALGPYGWTQVINFLVAGVLMVAFAVGVRRELRARDRRSFFGPVLLGLFGVGLIGAGLFLTDPVSGYPPGTAHELRYTWHGALHDGLSMLVFLGFPIACLVFARRFLGWRQWAWAAYSALSAVVFLVLFVLAGSGFAQEPGYVDVGGLMQRLCISVAWLWITLFAVHLIRTRPLQPCGRPPGHPG